MGDVLTVGFVGGPAIPPIAEHMQLVDAGPIAIGVEYRLLTDEIIDATGIEREEDSPFRGFQSQGVSIHVFDAATNQEHLRFDVFDGDPHYHYINQDENIVVVYDRAACGDMWQWTLACLDHRLPDMLRQAKVDALAERVDPGAIRAALPMVEALAEESIDQSSVPLSNES